MKTRRAIYNKNVEILLDGPQANKLPERSASSFVAAIFELGLKHSSPKVSSTPTHHY